MPFAVFLQASGNSRRDAQGLRYPTQTPTRNWSLPTTTAPSEKRKWTTPGIIQLTTGITDVAGLENITSGALAKESSVRRLAIYKPRQFAWVTRLLGGTWRRASRTSCWLWAMCFSS